MPCVTDMLCFTRQYYLSRTQILHFNSINIAFKIQGAKLNNIKIDGSISVDFKAL